MIRKQQVVPSGLNCRHHYTYSRRGRAADAETGCRADSADIYGSNLPLPGERKRMTARNDRSSVGWWEQVTEGI